jgi:cytochrome c-type biogenesis protein CcmH/NrfG
MVLGGAGDLAGAEQAFREAVQRDEQDAQYAYNLGLALERQGRPSEAATWYAKALDRDPKFAAARQHLESSRRER